MRILRIFKMVRHFVGLQSLVYTLHQAYKDLGLILIIISVTVLMFSSLVFAFEQDSKAIASLPFIASLFYSLSTLDFDGFGSMDFVCYYMCHLLKPLLIRA